MSPPLKDLLQHDDRPWAEIEAAAEATADEILARWAAEAASNEVLDARKAAERASKPVTTAQPDKSAGEHRDDV